MLNDMKILKLRNCTVSISPLCAIIAMMIIFYCVQTMTTIDSYRLHSFDHIIISFLILTGSMVCLLMHEYAHVLAARRMRLPVKEITVSLFGAYMSLDCEPLQPKEALVISIAGPVANIFAGIILYAGHLAFLQSDIVSTVFFCLSVFNGILGAYNLMPVMPLDGGLIVRSALWLVSGNWTWSMRKALLIGNGFAVLCIIAGIMLIFMQHSFMSAVLFILGLSLWQSEKLAYQRMLAAKLLNIVNPKGYRKEVMRDAIR
jgi:Zn-dependent protease